MDHLLGWSIFGGLVLVMLVLDLAVAHRRPHAVTLREAAVWSAVWVSLALLFGAGVFHFMGPEAGLQYFTGWLIEKALSVDNIFILVVLFGYFGVPARYRHRVLFWGVPGALEFVGVKMLVAGVVEIPVSLSLGVVGLVLATAVVASMLFPPRDAASRSTV